MESRNILRSRITTIILVAILSFAQFVEAQTLKNSEVEKWRADLQFLKEQLEERHVDLYHKTSKEEFEATFNALIEQMPSLTEPEVLVKVAQLIALIGDGHTSFYAGNQKKKWFGFYAIKFWSFSDGIYVIGADLEHKDLIGKRLVAIDKTSVEDAINLVSTTISADNPMEYQYTVPYDLNRAELLHVLKISESSKEATFKFEDGSSSTFKSIGLKPFRNAEWYSAHPLYKGERPPSMRLEFLFATPLTLPHLKERKYYWYAHLPDENAIYFQYNVCWDQKDRPTFAAVTEEMFKFMDENPVERLIIDVRQNTGGEPAIAQPLIDELSKRKEFTEEGRLFVLTGRRTFSAALTNAAHLRSKVNARVVGESPRGKPNNPSEGRDIDLKKTKIWLTVSTQFVERDNALGDADYLPVEIEVPVSFEEYQSGIDRVLEAALKAEIKSKK